MHHLPLSEVPAKLLALHLRLSIQDDIIYARAGEVYFWNGQGFSILKVNDFCADSKPSTSVTVELPCSPGSMNVWLTEDTFSIGSSKSEIAQSVDNWDESPSGSKE